VLMWWRKKTLTFEQLHESITAHFREVVSLVRALQAYPQPGLLDQLFGSGRAPYEWNRIHALNSPLASLIQKRREQLTRLLADLQSWDAIRLSTTRRKIEFDLAALVITRPPIHNPAYSVTTNLRPYTDKCSQENRFLNHLLMELDAAAERLHIGQNKERAAQNKAPQNGPVRPKPQTEDEKRFDEKKSKRYVDILDDLFEDLTVATARDIEIRKLYKQLRREIYMDSALTEDEKDELLDRLEKRYTSKMKHAGFSIYEEE